MISFRCTCGEPMDVPAELAGESLQCPACKRLVDVPRLGDLSLADDGTVIINDAHRHRSGLEDKFVAFGGQTDMRPTVEEFLLAGTGPADEPTRRPTPRYDPVTGELMVPVEILNDDLPPAPVIDPNAQVLGYARRAVAGNTPAADPASVTWWNLPWKLISGMSLMSMIVILTLHVVISGLMMLPGFNVLWVLPSLFVTITVIAHYCNTMEDFGPNQRDRVPVLLRNAAFDEDVMWPLFHFGTVVFFAFGPLIVVTLFGPEHLFRDHEWVLYALLAWGMLLFPPAVFTTVCGGTLHNLMPQRLISVVQVAPGKLALGGVTFWLAMLAYGIATSFIPIRGPSAFASALPSHSDLLRMLLDAALMISGYAAAVFLMHVAAAWMGLIYRDHHYDLNWVLQRHDRAYRTDTMAELFRQRGRPVVTPGDPNHPQVESRQPKRVLPLQQHEGFEVKL